MGISRSRSAAFVCVLFASALSTCVHPERIRALSVPPPENVLVADDGYDLPLRIWLPDGPPHALVIGAHGLNDYGNAFAHAGAALARRGIAVYAFDQRGFGTTVDRGGWSGAERMAADMAAVARFAGERHADAPVFLLGQSMGGAVATIAATRYDIPRLAGLVLSAPAIWPEFGFASLMYGLLRFGAMVAPNVLLPPRQLSRPSTDEPAVLAAMHADPLILHTVRAATLLGVLDLMAEARERASSVKVPVLILLGDHDVQIPRAGVAQLLENLPKTTTVLALYTGAPHLLMRSSVRNVVVADTADWILEGTIRSRADIRGRICKGIILDPKAACAVHLVTNGQQGPEEQAKILP